MKNIIAALAVASAILATPATAAPAEPWQTYVGAGWQGVRLNDVSSGLPSNVTSGINFHIGARMGKYYAVELGFSKMDTSEDGISGTTSYRNKLSISVPTVDGYAFLPLFHGPVSLIATAGIGYFTGHAESNNPSSSFNVSKNAIGFRAGGGIQWRPSQFFSLDLIGRYQYADVGFSKSGLVFGLTGNIYF